MSPERPASIPQPMIYWRRQVILLFGTLVFTSCSKPPSLSRDRDAGLTSPAQFEGAKAITPKVSEPLLKQFGDSTLRKHVATAITNNPDLKVAASRLSEAGYNIRVSKAPLLPTLEANGGFTRRQFANLGFGNTPLSIPPNNSFDATLDARWEVDLWGRLRAGVRASKADAEALKGDYLAARQSIAAQTMQSYMDLAGLTERVNLVNDRLASFQNTLKLVESRFEPGTASWSDVNLARTDVETARAEFERLKDSRDQASRRLRTLTGLYPSANLQVKKLPRCKSSVPSGLPSDLLMRRPDIVAAYQRIRAADSRVTVAHRALFPSFTLTANGGRSAPTLQELSNANFTTWNIIAGLSAPIFDGGRLRNELGASYERAKQAYFNYQKTVLTAFQEVEDALGSETALARQEQAMQSAFKAAETAEIRLKRDYELGAAELLNLLEAQRRTFNTKNELLQLKTLRLQNRVTLALALAKGV